MRNLKGEVDRRGWVTPARTTRRADAVGNRPFSRGHLYRILTNPIYIGKIVHKDAIFEGQHPAIIGNQLWKEVQDRLAGNLQGHRTRSNAANPSLLAGLVFEDQGRRLTSTHAKKGAKRYRYYVSESLHVKGREAEPTALRWPAQELEDAVLGALGRFLIDESRLLSLMGSVEAEEARIRLMKTADLAAQIGRTAASDRINILKRIVARVTVQADCIKVAVRQGALWSQAYVPVPDEPVTTIDVPVSLKRCGMAVRLIVQASGSTLARGPDPKLVALVAKAHDWFARLKSVNGGNVLSIAQQEDVTSSYVTRLIYIAFLAPDIVQRILKGNHPVELNAKRLLRNLPLPLSWEEQRVLLGMAD